MRAAQPRAGLYILQQSYFKVGFPKIRESAPLVGQERVIPALSYSQSFGLGMDSIGQPSREQNPEGRRSACGESHGG